MAELSSATRQLISQYVLWKKSLKPREDQKTIHVDEVASKVAAFYEQIRTIIDWKEEHLMRRTAIIRKLKRRFIDLELTNFSAREIAEPLVIELIRGGFFPNNKIEESKFEDVQRIIEKYVFILKHSPENKKGKAGLQFYSQLVEIAACEIEESLAPSLKEMALIDYMFTLMKERIRVSETIYQRNLLTKEETDLQIYIAVQQSLFKLDAPIINYNLLRYKYEFWDHPSEEQLLKISQNIYQILGNLDRSIYHVLSKKFYTICEKYDTPYLLLGDILAEDDPEQTGNQIQEPSFLEDAIRKAYTTRLADLKTRIQRAAVYSTASIFITKILSLIIIEVILARLLSGHLNILSIFADVLIPTVLMAVLVLTIQPPSQKNIHLVIMEAMKIAYQKEKAEVYEIKLAKRRSVGTRFFLSLIYLIGAIISFGFIYAVFTFFNFPITSVIINIIFIALILFTGTAIRTRSRELSVEDEPEGIGAFFSDILLLPIAGLGRWLSHTWKQYNAIAAFFNALIDMPFSAFVEFLERWRGFIKEKKEDLR